MAALAQLLQADKWPLYLWGPTGVGKSYAAANVFVLWQGVEYAAKWVSYLNLTDTAIGLKKHGTLERWRLGRTVTITEASFWRTIQDVELLVIDEIALGKSHDWRTEIMWDVLEARKNRPLILTGNVPPSELIEVFDERIQSRILAGSLFGMTGEDKRLVGLADRSVVEFESKFCE